MVKFVRMKLNVKLCFVFLFWTLLYNSCQNSTLFRSSRTLREEIQGTWNMSEISVGQIAEQWRFLDGAIYRYEKDAKGHFAKVDSGTYSINSTLTEPYLVTSELGNNNCYNAKWQIIALDDEILKIVHDQDCKGSGKGLLSREFWKEK
jgi:hypothetical protein